MVKETTKAPDNNKRLAMLEAGVSSLSVAIAANGLVKEGEAYDVFAVTVAAIKRAAELDDNLLALIGASTGVIARFAPDMELAPKDEAESLIAVQIRLLGQLAGHETPCDRRIHELEAELAARPAVAAEGAAGGDAAAAELEELTKASAAKDARIVELTNEVGELEQDLTDITEEKNRLANELAAANEGRPIVIEGADEAEEAPAAPAVRERPEAARDVGPGEGQLAPEELAELIVGGSLGDGTLELAFSNGEYEVVSLQPIPIATRDLVMAEGKWLLHPAVYAKLPATVAGEDLHGAGLLLEGAQVSYCAFPEPLRLEAGSERRFERTFAF